MPFRWINPKVIRSYTFKSGFHNTDLYVYNQTCSRLKLVRFREFRSKFMVTNNCSPQLIYTELKKKLIPFFSFGISIMLYVFNVTELTLTLKIYCSTLTEFRTLLEKKSSFAQNVQMFKTFLTKMKHNLSRCDIK